MFDQYVNAICMVVEQMVQLKYGQLLSGTDLLAKMKIAGQTVDAFVLVEIARAANGLCFKDPRDHKEFSLRFHVREVDFEALMREVGVFMGTACAVAVVEDSTAKCLRALAVFRKAYDDQELLVGSSPWLAETTSRFNNGNFRAGILVDPEITAIFDVSNQDGPSAEIQLPAVLTEYRVARAHADEVFQPEDEPQQLGGGTLPSILSPGRNSLASSQASSRGGSLLGSQADSQFSNQDPTNTFKPCIQEALSSQAPTDDAAWRLKAVLDHPHANKKGIERVLLHFVKWVSDSSPSVQIEAQEAVYAAGLHFSVVRVMNSYSSTPPIASLCCRFVGGACDNQTGNIVAFAAAGVLTSICTVMDRHTNLGGVQHKAIECLGCLCFHENIARQAVLAGVVKRVIQAMENHQASAVVVGTGCWVLLVLAEHGRAPLAGMQEIAINSKGMHPTSESVINSADHLLSFLQECEAGRSRRASVECGALPNAVHRQPPKPKLLPYSWAPVLQLLTQGHHTHAVDRWAADHDWSDEDDVEPESDHTDQCNSTGNDRSLPAISEA